jgi:hypothetical protein
MGFCLVKVVCFEQQQLYLKSPTPSSFGEGIENSLFFTQIVRFCHYFKVFGAPFFAKRGAERFTFFSKNESKVTKILTKL